MTPGLHGHGATTQTTPILRRIGLGAAIERELAQQHVLLPRRRLYIARGGPRGQGRDQRVAPAALDQKAAKLVSSGAATSKRLVLKS